MKKIVRLLLAIFSLAALPSFSTTLEGLNGTLTTPSAQPLGHLGLTLGVGGYGHTDVSMVRHGIFLFQTPQSVTQPDTAEIPDLISGTFLLNGVLGVGRGELGISIPLHGDFINDTEAKRLSGVGLGDPRLSAKTSFTLAGNHLLDLAFLGTLTVPTSSPAGFLPKQAGYVAKDTATVNRHFASGYGIGASGLALWTLDPSTGEAGIPMRTHLALGVEKAASDGGDHAFLLKLAMEFMATPALTFFFDLDTRNGFAHTKGIKDIGKDRSTLDLGFTTQSEEGMFFTLGVQKSLSGRPFRHFTKTIADTTFTWDARSLPSWAVGFTMGWSGSLIPTDSDRDGIPNKQDPCPNEREDQDGYQDEDGCPEYDNDFDSVPDVKDKCPTQPEDLDGFQDDDGCPDPDNDNDGVLDGMDKCPLETEDMDGFEDYDGCPDLDNDQDGVVDAQDKCPGMAEDRDGFEDQDGCPEADNDQDKIPDPVDQCPLEPETYNGFEDGDGCPDTGRSGGGFPGGPVGPLEKRNLIKGVKFRNNSAELMPESFLALDALASQLTAAPEVLVEVRAYMDDGDELAKFRLSEGRANAVRRYLMNKGIPGSQVQARGMGSKDPLATNKTAAGRNINRRIEVHRLN